MGPHSAPAYTVSEMQYNTKTKRRSSIRLKRLKTPYVFP